MIYQHYKGGYYNVLQKPVSVRETYLGEQFGREQVFIAKHTETEEEIPVYLTKWSEGYGLNFYSVDKQYVMEKPLILYEGIKGEKWLRPLSMFLEHVEFEGRYVERFKRLKDEEVYDIIRELQKNNKSVKNNENENVEND
ncbi:DUF1653 domain-containing protein [Bacillus thuringiensis]|uniref:DUF1653 domain-containing protein n=1 Tax=Bacillus thuringiensis TaxID=1428 RepID=UPI000BF349AF|nr:DUF1653 domain-containing protein [Bacillus thuringiensis]PEV64103.1 hypothetical protein CN434_25180 [Bacillus thuringiensis]